MNVDYLAEELHKTYRAACKANKVAGKHDHGYQNCHRKSYFRKRAASIIAGEHPLTVEGIRACVRQLNGE